MANLFVQQSMQYEGYLVAKTIKMGVEQIIALPAAIASGADGERDPKPDQRREGAGYWEVRGETP